MGARLDWLTVKIPFADMEDPDDGDGSSDALYSDDVRLCKWWNSIRPSSYRQFHPSKSEGHSLYSECIWLAFKISYMEGREKFPSSKMLPDYFISKLLRCILKSDSDTWRENITSSATNQARLFTTYVEFRANDDWGFKILFVDGILWSHEAWIQTNQWGKTSPPFMLTWVLTFVYLRLSFWQIFLLRKIKSLKKLTWNYDLKKFLGNYEKLFEN